MLTRLKRKGIGFYLELVAAVLAIVTLILGLNGQALLNNTNFGVEMIVVVVLGAVLAIASLFLDFNFWGLLPAVCYFVAFGLVINGGAAVIMDKINNVVYSGGNFDSVVLYLGLLGAACLLSIVACFSGTVNQRKVQ